MSKEYELKLVGQSYYGRSRERTYDICFTEPEKGIDEHTGILLLVAGFGGNINSNVYKKIRKVYSDKYNLIVIQADYMGSKYLKMFENYPVKDIRYDEKEWSIEEIEKILDANTKELVIGEKKSCLDFVLDLGETEDEFAEMGVFQAMDNIRAIKVVMDIVKQNGYKFNENKIIAFGDSHGAYLLYVMNRLCPELFTTIIDNSAWLFPQYIFNNRSIQGIRKGIKCNVVIEYNLKKIIEDEKVYDLCYIYTGFMNQANIYSFHGKDDNIIPLEEKESFLEYLENVTLHRVGIDIPIGDIFRDSKHSCGADYLKLLDFVFENYPLERQRNNKELFLGHLIETEKFRYEVITKENEFNVERRAIKQQK